MTGVLIRLAFVGLRRRALQAVLTAAVVAAAAAALTLALTVGAVADSSYERTLAATNGAHVRVTSPAGADLLTAERLPGVVASSGPVPFAISSFSHGGQPYAIRVTGVGARPPVVDRPVLDEGRWPRQGELLLERSFARMLGLSTGDRLRLAGGPELAVSGVGLVAKSDPYPQSQPGIAFSDETTLARVQPDRSHWGHLLGLRLTNPADAPRVAAEATALGLQAVTWQHERAESAEDNETIRTVFLIFAVLLVVAGGLVLVTIVTGRVVAQTRELALLKAVGLTPAQVAGALTLEHAAIAVVGALAGVAAGVALAPVFVARSEALLEASGTQTIDGLRAAIVVATTVAAAAAFTFLPALRAARRPVGRVLAGSASPHGARRAGGLVPPLPVGIGVRDTLVRPGATVVTVVALALTVACATATLGMEASLDAETVGTLPHGLSLDPVDPNANEERALRPVVYALDAVLLLVGLVNLVATVLLTLRARVRDLALLRAVGLTPRQSAVAFLSSQAATAVAAAALGIPLGLVLLRGAILATGGGSYSYPPWWAIAALVPATVAVVLLVAAPLTRRATSIGVVDALRYE